jgi:hypothetical protein
MTMKIHALLALTLLLVAFSAEAATITPTSPTEQDAITATIDVPGTLIYDPPSTSVIGNMIRTNLSVFSLVIGPPAFIAHQYASFGPLPQGTYTYQVFQTFQGEQPVLLSQQTIVVAPAIPMISSLFLSILALFLAAIACFALGNHV